jgi:chaperonin GroEL
MGVVPGGGACMLFMSCEVDLKNKILAAVGNNEDERLGVEIMFRSLPAPMKQIAKNAGLEGNVLYITYVM